MERAKENKEKSIKADIIMIAGIFAVGAIVFLVVLIRGRRGGSVEVRIDGEVTASYSLLIDREIDIKTEDGGVNHLVIKNGEAWVDEASCPDGLCKGMGHISRKGQSIICLPNHLVIEVREDDLTDDADDVDVIVK